MKEKDSERERERKRERERERERGVCICVYVCVCVCGRGATVRHVKYFMSGWSREKRVPRKVGSTHLLNSG